MCKGGNNSTTTTTTPPPQVMAQYENVQNQANSAAGNPYYFYPGQMVAGMSPDQTSAISATGSIAGGMENMANTYGMAQPFINAGSTMTGNAAAALGGAGGALSALENPANTVGLAMPYINEAGAMTAAGASPVTAGQINSYMNPFLQQVGQTTMAEMNQQNLMQQQGLVGNAAASGALGGNRIGLAQAALANQQNLAENATLANINSQGFNTALGAAQTTKGQQLQGGFMMGQNGQLAENAALSGLSAPLSAAEGLAGSYLPIGSQYGNLGGSNEAAALSGMQAGLTGATAQFGMGTAEQQQQQNQLTAAQNQWLGSVQYPFQNTNFLAGIQSGMGSLMGGTSTTTPPKPSTFSQVLGTLGSIAGIAGAAMALKTGGRAGFASGGAPYEPHVAKMAGIAPMDPTAPGGPNSETGSIVPIHAHSTLPPAPPASPPVNVNAANGAGGGGAGGLMSGLGSMANSYQGSWLQNLIGGGGAASPGSIMNGTATLYNAGGRVPRAGGGSADYSVPTPMSEQILDFNEMSQLMPGAPVQKTQYQAPQGVYARGGPVAGFAKGGAPVASAKAPVGGPSGISSMPLIGAMAGLSAPGAGQALPGDWQGFTAPVESTPAMGAPVAGMASVAAPQAGGLAMGSPTGGARFAPVTEPGGASSGPITDPSGIPSNYINSIYQSSPYFNSWSTPTAPSSGLHPNTPAPAAPAAPTPESINKMVQMDLLQQQQAQQNLNNMNFQGAQGNKRGGRIEKAAGGMLSADPSELGYFAFPGGATADGASAPTPPPPAPPAPSPAALPFDPSNPASVRAAVAASPAGAPAGPPPIRPEIIQSTPDGPSGLPQFNMPNGPTPGGVSPGQYYGGFAAKVAQAESGGNDLATNPRSSATGPDQFTNGTWLDVMHQFAPGYSANRTPAQLLAMRTNPTVSKEGTEAYAMANGDMLKKAGFPVSYTTLDLAHRLGPAGAEAVLSAPGNTPLTSILPADYIRANPELATMTASQMIAQSGVKMGASAARSGLIMAQNGASDVGSGKPGSRSVSPFQIPGDINQALQSAAEPLPHLHVPRTSGLEKMMESPWMALADAGFHMMAGTSPFAAVNIGQGAEAGVNYAKSMLGQQRERQGLQLKARQQNLANQIAQREQALKSAGIYEHAASNAVSGYQALPAIQGADITANNVPGVARPPEIPGLGAPPPAASVGSMGSQPSALPQFSAREATGLTPSAPPPPSTVVGTLGQTMSYPQALAQARELLVSPNTRGAAQQWLSAYGPQAFNADVKEMSDQVSAAEVQKQQLAELRTAAADVLTGPGAKDRASILRAWQTLHNAIGVPIPKDINGAATSAQIIPKIATFIQSGLGRMASDRGGAVVMQEVMAATPNILNSRQGLDKLVTLYDTLANRQIAMGNYVTQAVQSGQMTFQQAQNAFNRQFPSEYWYSRVDPLPIPPPAQRTPGYVYSTGSGPAGEWNGQTFVPIESPAAANQ